MGVRAKIELAGETGRGLVRHHNEDNFCLITRPDDNASLVVVTDGIGGRAGGDVASYVCCRMMCDAWRARTLHEMSTAGAEAFLKQAIEEANRRLIAHNRFNRGMSAMGTTIVCAVVFADRIVAAHAGDSRLYMSLPGRGLVQLTRDHVLQRLVQDREVSREILRDGARPMNTIYQAVGTCRALDPEIQTFERSHSARYLWCSDGLSRYVPESRIAQIMECDGTARDAVNLLMREVLLSGAPDNVTAVCGFPEK